MNDCETQASPAGGVPLGGGGSPYLSNGEDTTGPDGTQTSYEEGYRYLQDRVVPFLVSDVLSLFRTVRILLTLRIGIQGSVRRDRNYGTAAGERSVSLSIAAGRFFLDHLVTAGCLQAGCRRIGTC